MEQFLSISDGNHDITWNVTAVLNNVREKNPIIYEYAVEELYDRNDFTGNAEYAMKTNNDEPCIIVKFNEHKEILLDGHHRLYKAKQLGIKSIKCYVLPVESLKNFVVDYKEEIYVKVISSFAK